MLSACGGSDAVDGGVDAPLGADAGSDAFIDAGRDVGSDAHRIDAPDASVDVGPIDAGPIDAGPDVTAEVDAALELVCGLSAYANCTAPWACGCDVVRPPAPELARCTAFLRDPCDAIYREELTRFFATVGVRHDPGALAECVALANESFDACLPSPAIAPDLPARCFDVFVLGAPIGTECPYAMMRCADGMGICRSGRCERASSLEGASCEGTCGGGLSCIEGACRARRARDEPCNDHEDCDGLELCVGGRCAPPVAPGGACDATPRCTRGSECVGGICVERGLSSCMPGTPMSCGSGDVCRPVRRAACRPRFAEGERCASDDVCAAGLVCDTSRLPAVCGPAPVLDEPCSGTCSGDLVCVTDAAGSRCASRRRMGEPCARVRPGLDYGCARGLSCNMGVCNPPPGLGERCSEERLCGPELACREDAAGAVRCQSPLGPGDDCTGADDACAAGLFCAVTVSSANCRPLPMLGEPCPDERCPPDLECRPATGGEAPRCLPIPEVGESCVSRCATDAFCASLPDDGECGARICDFLSGVTPPS